MTVFDVVTIGSATVDVHAVTEHSLVKVKRQNHFQTHIAFPSGCKVLIDELLYTIGGGGTNTAVCFSRLGLKTGYIGSIGTDSAGKDVKELLKKEKIKFLGHTCTKKTGYSVILDSKDKDRAILTFKGANNFLNVTKCKPFQAKWLYLSSMVGDSYESQVAIAKKSGAKIAFNPSEYQTSWGISRLKSLLSITSVLVLNKEELWILTGIDDTKKSFLKLKKLGIQTILCTDGPRMMYAYHTGKIYSLMPPDIEVVESTGAGDAFASTFVAMYSQTDDFKQSLIYGMTQSLSVLTHHGAKEKLLSKKELDLLRLRFSQEVQLC